MRGPGGEALALELEVGEDPSAELAAGGAVVELRGPRGEVALRYGELYAYDATGRSLATSLGLAEGRIVLQVDARGAVYPVTVDPLLWVLELELLASDGGRGRLWLLGRGLGNDRHRGGADGEITAHRGAAYVFVRSGGILDAAAEAHRQRRRDAATLRQRGRAVRATRALVGAYRDDDKGVAAYVFVRSGTTWTQRKSSRRATARPRTASARSVALAGTPRSWAPAATATRTYVRLGVRVRPRAAASGRSSRSCCRATARPATTSAPRSPCAGTYGA